MNTILAGRAKADERVSEVMRAFENRKLIERRDPLAALAFHAIAIAEGRSDNGICDANLLAALGAEARRALLADGHWPLNTLDNLYLGKPWRTELLSPVLRFVGRDR